jgi:hypothetical protein
MVVSRPILVTRRRLEEAPLQGISPLSWVALMSQIRNINLVYLAN